MRVRRTVGGPYAPATARGRRRGSRSDRTLPPSDRVLVGRVLKTRGLDGEVKLRSFSDLPDRFRIGASFWAMASPPARVTVEAVESGSHGLYVRFREWRSVEVASAFLGCDLVIPSSERPALTEGRYYYDQLIGLSAWTEAGEAAGIVRDVWSTGPHDVLVLEHAGRERFLPAVRHMVVRVDLADARLIVRPPDGWMDDDAL